MVCPKCRSTIADDSAFCPVCGTTLVSASQPVGGNTPRAPKKLGKSSWFAPVSVLINLLISIAGAFGACAILGTEINVDPEYIDFKASRQAIAEPMMNTAVILLEIVVCFIVFFFAVGGKNFKSYFSVSYLPFIIQLLFNSIANTVTYAVWLNYAVGFYLAKIIAAAVSACIAAPVAYFIVKSYLKNQDDLR